MIKALQANFYWFIVSPCLICSAILANSQIKFPRGFGIIGKTSFPAKIWNSHVSEIFFFALWLYFPLSATQQDCESDVF